MELFNVVLHEDFDELLLHLFQAAHVTQINDAMYSGSAFLGLSFKIFSQAGLEACLSSCVCQQAGQFTCL
jgi:hypothetical protein